MEQKSTTNILFYDFVKNLKISEKDNEILKSARTFLRGVIRDDFNNKFERYLENNYDSYRESELAELSMARQQLSKDKKRVKFLTQGSFTYNTLNKPQQTPPQQMDLDEGIYFRIDDMAERPSSKLLFSYVEQQVLSLAKSKSWIMKTKETCVRLEIDNDKHIDLPIYIVPATEFSNFADKTIDFDKIWMARRGGDWVQSDPRKIIDWVKDCKENYGGRYVQLCRIFKAWRDHQWEKSPLSSICIMRIIEMGLHDAEYTKEINLDLDILLYKIAQYMYNVASREHDVTDPSDNKKSLSDEIELNDWAEIKQRIGNLVEVMKSVLYKEEALDIKNAKLKDTFGKFFPDDISNISLCKIVAAAASTIPASKAQEPFVPLAPYASLSENQVASLELKPRLIKKEEKEWLKKNQPLLLIGDDNIIRGIIKFFADFKDGKIKLFFSSPNPKDCNSCYIEDEYQIEFFLNEGDGFPCVYGEESVKRIMEQSKKHGINNKADAHIYPQSNLFCLGYPDKIKDKIKDDYSLSFITDKIIIPYFYYQSYRYKFGEEPWPGMPH